MIRIAILISGSGSNMEALLDDIAKPDHPAEAVLVLSNIPEAPGLAKAAARGIPTATVSHRDYPKDKPGFEAAMQAALQEHQANYLCLAGFMRVLTADFVADWSDRILNIHPSLLPRHKGLNTHARALEAGDRDHGCTVHAVTSKLDTGPMFGQAKLQIRPGETAEALAARVLALEHQIYPQVLRRVLAGTPGCLTLG